MNRRNGCRLILLALLGVCICGCTRVSSGPVPLECSDLTGPVWVGLVPFEPQADWSEDAPARPSLAPPAKLLPVIGKNRRLTIAGRSFDTDLPMGIRIHSAASHDACGYLTVVSAKATVFLLRRQGNWYVTVASGSVEKPSTVLSTRFSFVPGLVYLLYDDDALADELRYDHLTQSYSDFVQRFALTDAAARMDGIPWDEPTETPLHGAYQTEGRSLHLLRSSGVQLNLNLPEPLVEPQRSGPMDDLAQSVFIFPEQRIVCHVEHGWAVYSPAGQFLGYFQFDGPSPGWWMDPIIRDGQVVVRQRTGPGGNTYRLDLEIRTSVEIDRN